MSHAQLSLHNSSVSRKASRGFTLIELLVVIAIIGVLSSVILAALNTAREKAYNARRFSDLQQMQTALNAYYADYGQYPITTGTKFYSSCNSSLNYNYQSNQNNVVPGLAPNYIPSVPIDPQSTVGQSSAVPCYAYISTSNGSDYVFMDYVSGLTGYPLSLLPSTTVGSAFYDSQFSGGAWAVYSPNAFTSGL